MNIDQAIEYIESQSWKGCEVTTDRMKLLMEKLGNPQDSLRFVHVAGTNGKGSTCAMLASVLKAAGLKCGLHTSPHLVKYNERIKINGVDISDEDFCDAAAAVKAATDQLKLSFMPTVFERITAMAFYYFAKQKCDIVVLEVGLGGRYDASNVIKAPLAAVICNLDLEHTELLGNTIEEIANEKGGIIKKGSSVVMFGQGDAAQDVIKGICKEEGTPLVITDEKEAEVTYKGADCQIINYRNRKNIKLNLIGTYQFLNALTVLDTVDILKESFCISEEAVRYGLENVYWPGRFQVLLKDPYVLLDGAHNPNGVRELARCLRDYFDGVKFTFVCGVMADKDYAHMFNQVAPYAKGFITVRPDCERALSSEDLKAHIENELKLPAMSAGTVEEGIEMALKLREEGENVCIFGSLYEVGDVIKFFANR